MCQRDGLRAGVAFYVHVMWDLVELLRERSGARSKSLSSVFVQPLWPRSPLLLALYSPGNSPPRDFAFVHVVLSVCTYLRAWTSVATFSQFFLLCLLFNAIFLEDRQISYQLLDCFMVFVECNWHFYEWEKFIDDLLFLYAICEVFLMCIIIFFYIIL